jgi:hypothetical protein
MRSMEDPKTGRKSNEQRNQIDEEFEQNESSPNINPIFSPRNSLKENKEINHYRRSMESVEAEEI